MARPIHFVKSLKLARRPRDDEIQLANPSRFV